MGTAQKPTESKGSHPVRAGKKKPFVAPLPPNLEKQKKRDMGEQQFHSNEQLTVLATKMVVDKKTNRIVAKVYDAPVSFLWDSTRKHFVYSPPGKEAADND